MTSNEWLLSPPSTIRRYGPIVVVHWDGGWWARLWQSGPGIKGKRLDSRAPLLFSERHGGHAAIIVRGWYFRYLAATK